MAADGDAWRVHSGGKRADFVFYDAAGFAKRYPDAARAGGAPEGAAAVLRIGTSDLAAATKALGPARRGARRRGERAG